MKRILFMRSFLVMLGLFASSDALFGAARSAASMPDNGIQKTTEETKDAFDVIVVGAGVAGLACAKKLKENDKNCKVLVLEGNNRIGGRIWTDRSLGEKIPVDLGAGWIHGPDGNPITDIAKNVGLAQWFNHTFTRGSSMFDVRGNSESRTRLWDLGKELKQYASDLFEEDEKVGDQSVQAIVDQFVRVRNLTQDDALLINNWVRWVIESDYAATASKLSLSQPLTDLGGKEDSPFQGDDVLLTEYDRIIDYLATGLDIRLNEKVTEIAYDLDGVTVSSASGKKITAQYVVCTVPLGVLKHGDITFTPDLPTSKKNAINRLQMGILDKIVLEFPTKFWPHSLSYVTETQGQASNFFDYSHYVPKPILIGFIAGDAAQELEDKKDEEIIHGVMTTLRSTQDWKTIPMPDPEKYLITRWGKNPFSYGSYSFVPVGGSREDYKVMAEPVAGKIFFAGEATNYNHPATVHGAYLSGIREADRIIKPVGAVAV